MANILGRGAYGQVRKEGKYAIKSFSKLSHLIQEFVAGYFLKGCRGIVQIHEANWRKCELKMDCHPMNLRKWMEQTNTVEDKMSVFYDILCGLAQMHRRGIVHGDIKPGNTLVTVDSKGKPHAVIADLGFVSLADYCKVDRTTAVYRDKVIIHGPSHDLYSLGIMIMELFGDLKVNRQANHEEIKVSAKKYISDKDIRKLIVDLTNPDYKSRPSAHSILESIFKEDPTLREKEFPEFKAQSGSDIDEIKSIMKSKCKEYKISRAKRGYKCLLHFLSKHKLKSKDYELYTYIMMMILSSLFGESGFNEKKVLERCKSKHEMISAMSTMLDDQDIINGLLMP